MRHDGPCVMGEVRWGCGVGLRGWETRKLCSDQQPDSVWFDGIEGRWHVVDFDVVDTKILNIGRDRLFSKSRRLALGKRITLRPWGRAYRMH